MKCVLLISLAFAITFVGPSKSFAASADEVIIKGKIVSFDSNFLSLKDNDGKTLIVPRKFLNKSIHESEQVELNLTKEQFQQIKLKHKN